MTERIKVSVVLTSYNHEKYLRAAIDSVLAQTFSDFELIVIDDGSTDRSWEIINSYTDARIRAFQNQNYKRGGEFFKRTFLNLCHGDYIAIHHSDDVWVQEKLERQVAYLDSHPEKGAVFTRVSVIDENGNPFEDKSHSYSKIFEQHNRDRHAWLNHFFYRGNALCHPSVLIRRICYEICGTYRFGFGQLGDLDMWVRLCLKYELHILPEWLTCFRVRSDEMNTSGNRPSTLIRTQFESYQILHNYLGVKDPDEFVKIFPEAAEYFKQNEYDLGFALAMTALKSEHNYARLFGMHQLWQILNDDRRAQKVKELYGFSNRDLTEQTAKEDVFSVAKLTKLYTQLNEQTTMSQSLSAQLMEKEQIYRKLSSQLAEQEHALTDIKNSTIWQVAQTLSQVYNRLLPPESIQYRVVLKFYRSIFLSRKIRKDQTFQQDLELIRSSGLFDAGWYLAHNHDVADARLDPLLHYFKNGGFEGRDPGPQFSSHKYLTEHEDARKAGINPLLHYIKQGGSAVTGQKTSSDTDTNASTAGSSLSPRNRVSLKEVVRAILTKAQVWVARRPTLRKWIGPLIPSRLRVNINRAIQADEQAANARINIAASEAASDHESYASLSERVKTMEQSALYRFVPLKPSLVNLDNQGLLAAAKSLSLATPEKPEISIVIPVHNNAQLTLECLITIAHHTKGLPYEVIIVDDGSDEETLEILSAIQNVFVIHHEERFGFTRTCNHGAEAARGQYVLFLNNDTQVTENWLQHLLDVFAKQDKAGAVGAKILYPDGRLQEAGDIVNQDGTTTLVGLLDDPSLPRYNFLREVDYCSAVCLMVRTDIFRGVGGFEELYSPAYYEDVDLCMKIRAQGLKIFYCPDATIVHHLSATSNKIDSSFKLQLVARNRQRFLERWQDSIDELNRVRLIAFYLPQFHPIPENDLWWGKGFTEWTNVTRARPNYESHYQPHLPADLGFYDLRAPEVMEQQVELAKRYNIDGFCYYYYWFHGKRLLDLPLERMLETGKPDFPFCLCWANENWSRRWDGSENSILIAQNHSDDDDRAVIEDISRYMQHPRYIRVDGKPVLLIYRASLFPNIKRTIEIWRDHCRKNGMGELHLVMVKSFEMAQKMVDPFGSGFDATVEFPPHNFMNSVSAPKTITNKEFTGVVGDYAENILMYLFGKSFEPRRNNYLAVFPRWDNTARRQNAPFIFEKPSPGAFQSWLEKTIELTRRFKSGDEKLVFINAWNEWAEGNHLEPDQKYGHRYLEATRNAVEKWQLG